MNYVARLRECGGRSFGALLVAIAIIAGWAAVASAASLSVGYTTTETLPPGSLVALANDGSQAVVAADATSHNNLVGVVVKQSTLALSQSSSQVQVSTQGTSDMLVSNLNGDVRSGDRIIASPLSGIGMKATQSGKIIGIAQGSLTAQSSGGQTQTVQLKGGTSKQVLIGLIPTAITVGYYTAPATQQSIVPAFLQSLANFIGGREVSPTRLIVSIGILLMSVVCVAVLIYGAARTSISALGRNPLAKQAINGGLTRVILLALAILVVTSVIVYVILRG